MTQRGRKSLSKLSIVSAAYRPPRQAEPPPPHLGKPEKDLWHRIHAEHDIEGPVATALLVAALEAHHRARSCREQIEKEGLVIKARGGPKHHPLLGPERAARQQMVACFRKLQVQIA